MTDATARLLITFALLAGFVALEFLVPARARILTIERFGRQAALGVLGAILARVMLGGGLVGVALLANDKGIGAFNVMDMPDWLAVSLCVLALDFAIWAQHLAMHHIPVLWRLHRVHHSDTCMDVSTALRFHPFEIGVSLAFKVAMILALGAPVMAVIVFEMVLGAGSLFTHANVRLPIWLEKPLRFVLVTPALHLIHHSPNPIETNSNFGFSTTLWDRLFGKYRDTALLDDGRIGLEYARAAADQGLGSMLLNPFRAQTHFKD